MDQEKVSFAQPRVEPIPGVALSDASSQGEGTLPTEPTAGEETTPEPTAPQKSRVSPPLLVAAALAAVCLALATFICISYFLYQQRNAPIWAENARLEGEVAAQNEANASSREALENLEREREALSARVTALGSELGGLERFLDEDAPDRATYLQDQMVTLLERRQELVRDIRDRMTLGINGFARTFGAAEFVPPEPVDVSREFLKNSVAAIAEGTDSSAAEVLGDVAQSVIDRDGEDLWDTVSSAALSSIGEKLSGAVRDAALDAAGLGGIVSAATSASSFVDTIKSFSHDTPDQALALTLQDALACAQQVTAVLNDPNADTAALRQAVYQYNRFCAYRWAAEDLRNKLGLSTGIGDSLYDDLAQVEAIDQALGVCAILLQKEGVS